MAQPTDGVDDWITPPSAAHTSAPVGHGAAHSDGPDDWITPSAHSRPASPPAGMDWNDVAHGIGTGLIKGGAGLLGLPADALNAAKTGAGYALTKPLEWAGAMSPETGAHLREVSQQGRIPLGSSDIERGVKYLTDKAGINSDDPTTTAGQYADTIASFVPGAALAGEGTIPSTLKAIGKYAVLPGATSETAGQLTKGTAAEPYARLAGAIAPGVTTLGVQTAWNKLSDLADPMQAALRKATPNLTPAQIDQAQTLVDQSRAANMPVSGPEAVSKVTNGATTLPELQRSVEESRLGAPIMKQFYADRPAQVDTAGRAMLDQIAAAPSDPYAVAPKVQQAAQGVMDDATQARTAAVKPLYEAANPATVPADEMNAHLDQINQMIARDKTGLLAPTLEKYRNAITATAEDGSRVPVTDIENLDRARKFFRDRAELPYGVSPDALDKETSAKVLGLLGDDGLKGIMTRASPDFEQGLNKYQDISQNTINPMLDQPIGKLADTGDFTKQNQILFNSKPIPGSHVQIGDAVRQIAAKDPEAAAQSARMFLEQQFEAATKADVQQGAANFYKGIYANDQQRKNVQAALRALPDGQVRANALDKFMEIASTMGQRLPPNSATAVKQEYNKLLEQGSPAVEMLANIPALASPAKLNGLMRDAYAKYTSGKNGAQLAQMFTSDDLSYLRGLNKVGAQSLRGRLMVLGLLAHQGANDGADNIPTMRVTPSGSRLVGGQ